ncbi:MAG: hemolysin family protein [Candidatus Rokuibacteriota bacterium]
METIWVEIVLIAVAILANGFFAGSEIALVSARVGRLMRVRDQGVRGAASALRLKESPEAFLATIQIAITLVGTLASAVGGAAAVEALTPWLVGLPLPHAETWAGPVALGFVIIVIAYASLVVGELAPKAVALRHPERIASVVARPIEALNRVSSRLVTILTVSTRTVLWLFGQRHTAQAEVASEDDVRHLLREGAARGVFEKVEEELVRNIFEFADTTVREIMVPRPNIRGLDVDLPPADVLRRAMEIGHYRIPVYRASIEHPVGVVTLKDLLRSAALGEPPLLARIAHPPLFVPETTRIRFLLQEFQRHGQNLAIVVDEYGSVVGLVTLEDVLEEIVGDIREEREPADTSFGRRLPDGSLLLEGTASIVDIREKLGLPLPESPAYHTLAGFMIHALGAIPATGASLTAVGHRLTVVEMEGPRILRVSVQREAGKP